MVQDAAQAPPAPPGDDASASGPALSAYVKPAEHGTGSGNGASPHAHAHARDDDDDDESEVDAWDILLEQAEENEPTTAGACLPPGSPHSSS
jgi:NAD-dependent histone deacetylase SIR2